MALLTHWIPPPGPSCLQISLQKAQRRYMESSVEDTSWDTEESDLGHGCL
jgi:hypothetical protein